MNLMKLRYFVEVARCGNFSEAARRLYTAQPNVSKQIAQMEQELDFPLFIRSKRSVKLTPAGEMIYEHIKDLPDDLDDLFQQAKALARKNEEHLSIGILEGQDVNALLLERLSMAQQQNPKLELEMERSSYTNLRNGLKNGHYDMIVTLDFDVEDEPEFRCSRIYSQPPAIAIHKNHPLAMQPEITLEELKNEPFVVISPQESPAGYDKLVAQCQKTGFTPRVTRLPRSLESLILCVEMGVGVALLDQGTRFSHDSAVRTIPLQGEQMYVVAACMKNDYRPVLTQVMKQLAVQEKNT